MRLQESLTAQILEITGHDFRNPQEACKTANRGFDSHPRNRFAIRSRVLAHPVIEIAGNKVVVDEVRIENRHPIDLFLLTR